MRGKWGQAITFAIVYDEDQKYANYRWIKTKPGDTIRKIVGGLGRGDQAKEVARLNRVAKPTTILRHPPKRDKHGKKIRYRNDRKRIRLPGTLRPDQRFNVYADFGGRAPRVSVGYAKIEPIDRPGRTGVSHFTGYDPVRMTLPVTFDAWESPNEGSGRPSQIEEDMALLERMGGRGDFHGASIGSPPLITVSTRDNNGKIIWLIPSNYQWSSDNDTVPLWRVVDIDWDESPLRNNAGNRMRQDVTVTVEAYTSVKSVARSLAKRKRGSRRGHTGARSHRSTHH
jgi:hypothetical protein